MSGLRARWFLSRKRRRAHISRAGSLVREGDQARDRRDWVRASRLYRRALYAKPGLADIWVQYGHTLKEQGDLKGAESAYREAISLNSQVADTHLQLGHSLKIAGHNVDAREEYWKAATLAPDLLEARRELTALGYSEIEIEDRIAGGLEYAGNGDMVSAGRNGTKTLPGVRSQLSAMQIRVAEFSEGWRRHSPALRNAVSTVAALGHVQARLLSETAALNQKLATADTQATESARRITDISEASSHSINRIGTAGRPHRNAQPRPGGGPMNLGFFSPESSKKVQTYISSGHRVSSIVPAARTVSGYSSSI